MAADVSEMTLRDFGRVLADRKWIVVTAVLISTVVAVALSAMQTPIYSAEAQVLILPRGQQGLFAAVEPINDRALATEMEVMEGEALKSRVEVDLGLGPDSPDVHAEAVLGTDVIAIGVRDANAQNAQTLANAYAQTYIDMRREQLIGDLEAAVEEISAAIASLQAEVDEFPRGDRRAEPLAEQLAAFKASLERLEVDAALTSGDAIIIESAELPKDPVEPKPALNALLAAAIGLLLGVGAAFLIDYLDDRVRNESDLDNLSEHPVLAVVPTDRPPDHRPIALSEPGHTAVESYRGLRTNLQFRGLDTILRVIQVTSSLPGEGKTTTAANLAVVLAQAGNRVAVVDADLRRPRIHQIFAVPQTPGLTDLLLGAAPRDIVNHVEIAEGQRISVYSSGNPPSNPSEMLGGRRMHQLLAEMGAHYDFVIVDSAPVLPVTDSVALASAVDGVLVVAYAGSVDRANVVETVERLERVSASVAGLVLNQAFLTGFDTYSGVAYASTTRPATTVERDSVSVDA